MTLIQSLQEEDQKQQNNDDATKQHQLQSSGKQYAYFGYHEAMSIEERQVSLRQFYECEDYGMLICSDCLSNGLHYLDLNLVIHYDFPLQREKYLQRAGVYGRFGHYCKISIALIVREDVAMLKEIERYFDMMFNELPEDVVEYI
jgi:superfamily II DNA/RNA helicase